jgi:hypothetical protein
LLQEIQDLRSQYNALLASHTALSLKVGRDRFDQAKMNVDLSVSMGARKVAKTSGPPHHAGVVSPFGYSTGQHYWEWKINPGSSQLVSLGNF